MKKFSLKLLADTVVKNRRSLKMTQQDLAEKTGMNRTMISRLETCGYYPSIPQLEALGSVLGFDPSSLFVEDCVSTTPSMSPMHIAVVGTGYVGLSLAVLLAQHNHVTAIDIVPERVDLINEKKSPIQDDYIKEYLETKELDLVATTNGDAANKNADYVIIAVPTNYDSKNNYF